jgi:ATP-dependent Clp protease protease subunit
MSPTPAPWGDFVRGQLFERRTIFVNGDIDDAEAGRVTAELMTLDASGDEPVELYVDAEAHQLGPAFAIMDTIDLLGVPVHATCIGRADGVAIGLVAVASRRGIAPHARVRLAEPHLSFAGRSSEVETWLRHHHEALAAFHRRLAGSSGRPLESVAEDLRAGLFLDAREAVARGLADRVVQPDARIYSLGRSERRLGFTPPPL